MRRDSSNELLNFLKDVTHDEISFTVDRDVQQLRSVGGRSSPDSQNYVVTSQSITLSNIDGDITDPIIFEDGGRRYKFTGVIQTSGDEAIAKDMEVTNI